MPTSCGGRANLEHSAAERANMFQAALLLIGNNTFDSLFVVASDVAYREGPLFQALDTGTSSGSRQAS